MTRGFTGDRGGSGHIQPLITASGTQFPDRNCRDIRGGINAKNGRFVMLPAPVAEPVIVGVVRA